MMVKGNENLQCGPTDCNAGCIIWHQADTERGMTQLEFLRSKEDMSGSHHVAFFDDASNAHCNPYHHRAVAAASQGAIEAIFRS